MRMQRTSASKDLRSSAPLARLLPRQHSFPLTARARVHGRHSAMATAMAVVPRHITRMLACWYMELDRNAHQAATIFWYATHFIELHALVTRTLNQTKELRVACVCHYLPWPRPP
jgi:hypothetical protein